MSGINQINFTDQERFTAFTDDITKAIVTSIKDAQKYLTDEQRIKLWDKLQEGYCKDCGSPHLPCHCTNDN